MSSNQRYSRYSARVAARERVRREGAPCALCGHPIDYTLPPGHPASYELDEILPISRGGSPTDPRNLQATHRRCNQRKGNRILRPETGRMGLPNSRDWKTL